MLPSPSLLSTQQGERTKRDIYRALLANDLSKSFDTFAPSSSLSTSKRPRLPKPGSSCAAGRIGQSYGIERRAKDLDLSDAWHRPSIGRSKLSHCWTRGRVAGTGAIEGESQ